MIGGMVRAKREIEIERNNARFHQIFFPGISYLKKQIKQGFQKFVVF